MPCENTHRRIKAFGYLERTGGNRRPTTTLYWWLCEPTGMTILTALDGERTPSRVVEGGADLARRYDEEHVVVHVMPQAVFEEFRASAEGTRRGNAVSYGDHTASNAIDEYTIEDGERHARGVARDVVRGTLDDTAGVTLQGRVGDPVEEILAEVDRRGTRYLVIGGRRRTPVGKAVFGSATQSLLLRAEVPVMTVLSE
jgi:nucleotide-binding universal stress UspA family protein